MINIALYSFAYLIVFFLTEVTKRRMNIHAEFTRKWIHIISGLIACTMPYAMLKNEILITSGLFFAFLGISKYGGHFSALHNVTRKTIGEIAFPVGVALAALAFLPNRIDLFLFGMVVMSLADPVAAIVGGKWPIFKLKVGALEKSLGGMLGFAATTFIIGLACNGYFNWELGLPILLGVSIVSAKIEVLQPFGIDDATLPIAAGGLIWFFTA